MIRFTFTFLFFLILIFLLHHSSSPAAMAAASHHHHRHHHRHHRHCRRPDIIGKTCKQSADGDPDLNYAFCLKSLQSAPRSKCADLRGLALISLKLAKADAKRAKSRAKALLKEYKRRALAGGGGRRYEKSCLETCHELYDDAAANLGDAAKMVEAEQYADANVMISGAVDAPRDCEEAFEEGGLPSPLRKENYRLAQHAVVGLAITARLEDYETVCRDYEHQILILGVATKKRPYHLLSRNPVSGSATKQQWDKEKHPLAYGILDVIYAKTDGGFGKDADSSHNKALCTTEGVIIKLNFKDRNQCRVWSIAGSMRASAEDTTTYSRQNGTPAFVHPISPSGHNLQNSSHYDESYLWFIAITVAAKRLGGYRMCYVPS
ncbi:hypothetical protein Cni_G27777 [Canna indica]|uniref:Pectinesterase inhibitor domain-containing protein n=1 Tax=Canna indica TaxID=4628 RepID=A0AAQ3L2G5_9LILI|nr:hypothetical protein Cni_G27777 [Canna indica]